MKLIRRAHDSSSSSSTLSYTQLRTLAIGSLLRDQRAATTGARVDVDEHEVLTDSQKLFDVWLDARHAAAAKLLFPGAVAAIAAVRARHPDTLLAAITNGRGDPLAMQALAPFFAFTVSGEDTDVHPHRKPSPVIYKAALERAGVSGDAGEWVHIGDDLVNDMRAAKELGALTVWLNPEAAAEPITRETPGAPFYSTISPAEAAARQAALANVDAGSVDVEIPAISDLPTALLRLSNGYSAPRPGKS